MKLRGEWHKRNKDNKNVDESNKRNETQQTQQGAACDISMEEAMKTEETKVVGIRLEILMRSALAAKAKENDRSMSRKIVYRLRKSLEQEVDRG